MLKCTLVFLFVLSEVNLLIDLTKQTSSVHEGHPCPGGPLSAKGCDQHTAGAEG